MMKEQSEKVVEGVGKSLGAARLLITAAQKGKQK